MSNIASIVLPLFAVIAAGFLLRKYRIVKPNWIHVLNAFVYYVSLPAIIVTSFWNLRWTGESLQLLLLNIGALVAFTFLLLLVFRFTKLSKKMQAAVYLTSIVGNTVYMGFPILGKTFGSEYSTPALSVATAHLVLGIVFSVLVVEYLVLKTRKSSAYLKDFIKNPLMISLGTGLLLSFLPALASFLRPLHAPVSMLGATASPVALFALGAFMHGRFLKSHARLSLVTAGIKLLAFPAFVWLFVSGFTVHSAGGNISLLIAGMPAAVTTFVIAEQFELDEEFVANSIVVSTVFSIVTISLLLAFIL